MNDRKLELIKQKVAAKRSAKLLAAKKAKTLRKAEIQRSEAILSSLQSISDQLGKQEVSVAVDTTKLEQIVADISITPEIKSGDVFVDTELVAKEVASLKQALEVDKTAALKEPLDKLIKAVQEPTGRTPGDYIPYRRVVKMGNILKFDDAIVSSVGGGGGVASDPVVLPTYGIARIDDASDPAYYGFENNSGDWYILRNTDSTGLWEYFAGTSGITTNWAGRAGYAYADKGAIF